MSRSLIVLKAKLIGVIFGLFVIKKPLRILRSEFENLKHPGTTMQPTINSYPQEVQAVGYRPVDTDGPRLAFSQAVRGEQ